MRMDGCVLHTSMKWLGAGVARFHQMHTAPEGSIRAQSTSTWLGGLRGHGSRGVLHVDHMDRRSGKPRDCARGSADAAWPPVMRPRIGHAAGVISPSLPRALGPPQRDGLRKILSSPALLSRVSAPLSDSTKPWARTDVQAETSERRSTCPGSATGSGRLLPRRFTVWLPAEHSWICRPGREGRTSRFQWAGLLLLVCGMPG